MLRSSRQPQFKRSDVGAPHQRGQDIGEVVASNDQSLRPGDLVSSWLGWREVFNASAGTLEKLETFGLLLETLLGVGGMPGLTAWVGLSKTAALKPGDVVFVSAAFGAVGSVAYQIAKDFRCLATAFPPEQQEGVAKIANPGERQSLKPSH
jgi:NADPH-dependent curcumin reductase CurA